MTLWRVEFGRAFHHAGRTRHATLRVGWYRLRLPDTHQPVWAVIYDDPDIDRTTVLLTNVPVYLPAIAKMVYNDCARFRDSNASLS
ncbi:MAG: hypothetical protein ACP5HM_16330 [Anaerolineae bacterium]